MDELIPTPDAQAEPPAMPEMIPLPAQGRGSLAWWLQQIQEAKDKREKVATEQGWKDRIQSYLGKTLDTAPKTDTIVVPKDFANVELKKAQLYTQLPEFHLTPTRAEFQDAAPIAQAVLKEYLGPRKIDANVVMNECLFDALCPSGLMCSKLGYESVTDGEKPYTDPMTGMVTMVPNVIHERYFWERVSPLKALIPKDFHGSKYTKSPWLGMEFDFDPMAETGLNPSETIRDVDEKPKPGVELWYYPAAVDGSEKHPEKMRRLLLKDGQVIAHEASPYQKIGPDGTLTGMVRNPIRIRALRYVSDSAYPMSDSAVIAPLVAELNKGRSQMVQQRDRSVPMRAVDRTRMDKATLDKIEKNEYQAFILTDGPPQEIFAEVSRAQFPRENFTFNEIIDRDIANTLGLSVSQDFNADGPKTATEASIFQGKTDVRLRRERAEVLSYAVEASEDVLTLIQMFADVTDYVRIVGTDGTARLQAWNKQTIAGGFAFSAIPDSAVYQDQAQVRKHATEVFQFLAASPFINQQELTAWYLRQQDLEPAKLVAPPKQPEPEKPKITFSFKGEDLIGPQAPLVIEILKQSGLEIPQGTVAAMAGLMTSGAGVQGTPETEPRQSGTAPMQSPLNKHAQDRTGQLPGGMGQAVQ